jgi:hypothetical protein
MVPSTGFWMSAIHVVGLSSKPTPPWLTPFINKYTYSRYPKKVNQLSREM